VSNSPRVLILGAAGQLGVELKRSFSNLGNIIALDRRSIDVTLPTQVRDQIRSIRPDVILNAAAYTAVDKAESEAEAAMAINAVAPGIIAEEALKVRALLVHYSTDYVFDGSKQGSWTEEDVPNPLNQYGASKLAGEQAIQAVGGKYFIFRTSWVYGPHGHNFLLTMLRLGRERDRLAVVDDQFGAPTSSIEIANATRAVVVRCLADRHGDLGDWIGIYNMSCSGLTSWYGFARRIFYYATRLLDGRMPEVTAIGTTSYPTPARRPLNSHLSNDKLKDTFGIELKSWEPALRDVIHILEHP
jgi:dTDP-4-dehydrorhamnose reductase